MYIKCTFAPLAVYEVRLPVAGSADLSRPFRHQAQKGLEMPREGCIYTFMTRNDETFGGRSVTDVVNCTSRNLRQATRAVTQAYDMALQPTGLRVTQFDLLATLAKLGDMPLTKLAEALVMDRTTLTRNLKPLVARKLIRVGTGDDQRVRQIGITPAGRTAFQDAIPYWRGAQQQLVKQLGKRRWAGLLDDLTFTVHAIQES